MENDLSRCRFPFSQQISAIEIHSSKALECTSARPPHLDIIDRDCVPKPNFLSQRRGAKTTARSNSDIDIAILTGCSLYAHAHTRADRVPIRLHSLQEERDPAIAVPRIFEQHIRVDIALKGRA